MYRALALPGVRLSPEEIRNATPAEIIARAEEARKRPSYAGGTHDTDWRCPECGHFTSMNGPACSKCGAVTSQRERETRASLRGSPQSKGSRPYCGSTSCSFNASDVGMIAPGSLAYSYVPGCSRL